jgi:hypothetical protein
MLSASILIKSYNKDEKGTKVFCGIHHVKKCCGSGSLFSLWDLDLTFQFDADPDVDPAPPHQSDANLRPLVYRTGPSTAQFEPPRLNCERPGPSMAPF